MSYEIVYTSSTAGLMPGTKGFCTVAATKGIAPNTLKVLESLSGYRNMHTPTGGPHPNNPKVYSHLILPSGESVLSRIVDAGLDYSGRTNKLAHHLVMLRSDQGEAGPSRILSCPGAMIEAWEGDSRYLPTRAVPTQPEMTGTCTAWQRATGDAGWASALANTACNGDSREAYIVFEEGMNCLALIDDALSLLPPKDRWQITFSTFLTSLPAKEYAAIPPHNNILKIDLTKSLGTAPDSPLAEAARSGARPFHAVKPTPLPLPANGKSSTADASDSSAFRLPKESERRLPAPKPTNTEMAFPESGNDATVISKGSDTWMPGLPPASEMPQNYPVFKLKRKSTAMPMVLTALVASLAGLLLGAGGFSVIRRPAAGSNAPILLPDPIDKNELDELKNKLASATKLINSLEAETAQLKIDLAQKKKEISSQNSKIETYEAQLVSEKKVVVDLKEQIAKLSDANDSSSKMAAKKNGPEIPQQALSPEAPTANHNPPAPIPSLPTIALFLSESTSPSIQGEKWDKDSVSLVKNLTGATDSSKLEALRFKDRFYGFVSDDGLTPPTQLLTVREKKLGEAGTGFQAHLKKWLVLKQDKDVKGIYRFGQPGWTEPIKFMAGTSEVQNLAVPDFESGPMQIFFIDKNWTEITPSPPQPPGSVSKPLPPKKSWYIEGRGDSTDANGSMFNVIRAKLELELKAKNTIHISLSYPAQPPRAKADAEKLKSATDVTTLVKSTPLAIKLIWPDVTLTWDENRKVNLETTIDVQFQSEPTK